MKDNCATDKVYKIRKNAILVAFLMFVFFLQYSFLLYVFCVSIHFLNFQFNSMFSKFAVDSICGAMSTYAVCEIEYKQRRLNKNEMRLNTQRTCEQIMIGWTEEDVEITTIKKQVLRWNLNGKKHRMNL